MAVCKANADSIGVNFTLPLQPLASTDSAGAVPQTNFNNVSAAASSLVLNNNLGVATTAKLTTVDADDFSRFTIFGATPDENLNNDHADNSTGTSWSFSLADIPYATYSIIVYDLAFTSGAEKAVTLGSTTFFTISPTYNGAGYVDDNAATPYVYTPATITDTTPSDEVIFPDLSGSSQTVSIAGVEGSSTEVGGFQIVETPEPTAATLLAIGVGTLMIKRRRV